MNCCLQSILFFCWFCGRRSCKILKLRAWRLTVSDKALMLAASNAPYLQSNRLRDEWPEASHVLQTKFLPGGALEVECVFSAMSMHFAISHTQCSRCWQLGGFRQGSCWPFQHCDWQLCGLSWQDLGYETTHMGKHGCQRLVGWRLFHFLMFSAEVPWLRPVLGATHPWM